MDLQLKGKKALVTGSTGGIGYAIALGLLREGVAVYINGRTDDKINEAITRLKNEVPNAVVEGIAADFSKVSEVNHLIKALPEIDILVNNVGVYGDQPFETTEDAEWLNDFEVNVLSGIGLSRHYAPLMKAKNWGRLFLFPANLPSIFLKI